MNSDDNKSPIDQRLEQLKTEKAVLLRGDARIQRLNSLEYQFDPDASADGLREQLRLFLEVVNELKRVVTIQHERRHSSIDELMMALQQMKRLQDELYADGEEWKRGD